MHLNVSPSAPSLRISLGFFAHTSRLNSYRVLLYNNPVSISPIFKPALVARSIIMARKPVAIAGTTLEGGGQLVRLAVGLSALLGIPIKIFNIRGGRPRGGGLNAQHLTAVNWLATESLADIEGAELKSKILEFRPTKPVCFYHIHIT